MSDSEQPSAGSIHRPKPALNSLDRPKRHWCAPIFRFASCLRRLGGKQLPLEPLADRGPLRVMFVITSMPVGGAETLLVNIMRGFDPSRIHAEVCCLKEKGPLGEELAESYPVHSGLLKGKYDVFVLRKLAKLFRERKIDAVITVGAGDKMFWGRLAAWWRRTPVIASALHSTGWPDGVGKLNRCLTPITDAFIAVAAQHGEFLIKHEEFPKEKVSVITNGVDTNKFKPMLAERRDIRRELGIGDKDRVVGIVAALRPEKNHTLFLEAATLVKSRLPDTHFIVVGEGPERGKIEANIAEAKLQGRVHMTGNRSDIPKVLSAMDLFSLTSHNEANPVSIMEAMACGVPVVATNVGSVSETVVDGETGLLAPAGDARQLALLWMDLLENTEKRRTLGRAAREFIVNEWSQKNMIQGYENLVEEIYCQKAKCTPISVVNRETTNAESSRKSPLLAD
jgi:glycosyltransferase involved in cell wall biosynthesis